MTPRFQRESAKIYEFPAGGRMAVGEHPEKAKRAADLRSPQISEVTFGGAWYHEAAIRESEQVRKP